MAVGVGVGTGVDVAAGWVQADSSIALTAKMKAESETVRMAPIIPIALD